MKTLYLEKMEEVTKLGLTQVDVDLLTGHLGAEEAHLLFNIKFKKLNKLCEN